MAATANAAGKTNVLRHDGNAFGMNGTEVGVLEESNQESLCSLLESCNGGSLKSNVVLVGSGNFPNETLEGQFADKEFCGFLVSANFAQCNRPRSKTVRSFDYSARIGGFLGFRDAAGDFVSGRFAGGLFGTGHVNLESTEENDWSQSCFDGV